MKSALKVILGIAVVLPACDGFVCSQERIKAIELANRGAEQFKNNLYDSAEKDLKQAIQTDPSYEIAYYNLGKVYQKQRKWDKAIEYFEGAVQRKPDNGNYQYDLGEAYLESKKIDMAEKALKAATAADTKLFKAWWRPGTCRT
jgi:tetratricopeptide (TPR) repeat protein